MQQYELIRRMILVDGLSIREVARRLGHSRKSIRKAIENAAPPAMQIKTNRPRPTLDPFMPMIRQWLTDDQKQPRKQRHTAVRVWERLTKEYQFNGSRRSVSDAVKLIRREMTAPEILVPIEHPCGEEFQVDWGEVTINLNHQPTKVMIFCVRSAYSKATFVRAYQRDDMASFMDAHVWLFQTLGGVPRRLAYDNLSTAVVSVGKRGARTLTSKFIELRSHYLFATRFCNVAAGNEKGHVENSVKRAERTYLTPVPSVTSMEQLNEHLRVSADADLVRQCKETHKSYGVLLEEERPTFLPLPLSPFIAALSRSQKTDRQSTVTSGGSRYSVPVHYACLPVVVRTFYDRVEVLCKNEIIATHARIEPGKWSLHIEHYLPVLERKPGLLDSGIPFKTRAWSDSERLLRQELEYRHGEVGTRQFLAIVLLCKEYPWALVQKAISCCVKARTFHEEAVRLELARLTQSPSHDARRPTLGLSHRPELDVAITGTRDLSVYNCLLDHSVSTNNSREEEVPSIVTAMDRVDPIITVDSLTQARSANDDEEENNRKNREAIKRSQLAGESTASTTPANDATRVPQDCGAGSDQ